MEQPEFLDSLNRDLALAIGNAIWAFARIEWAVTSALGRGGISLDVVLAELSFKQRVTILRKLLPEMAISIATRQQVNTQLNRIEKLSETRNLIAHNPWMIWIDRDANEIMTEIQHYTNPKKKLDLSALSTFTENCLQALEEFEAVANAL